MLDERDIPVYFLLTELYRNNKKILSLPKKVEKIAGYIVICIARCSE